MIVRFIPAPLLIIVLLPFLFLYIVESIEHRGERRYGESWFSSLFKEDADTRDVIRATNTVFTYHFAWCLLERGRGILMERCLKNTFGTRYYYEEFSSFSQDKINEIYRKRHSQLLSLLVRLKETCRRAGIKRNGCIFYQQYSTDLLADNFYDSSSVLYDFSFGGQFGLVRLQYDGVVINLAES